MTKRAILPALMISLLLGACGGGADTEARLEQRRDARTEAAFQFTADVTANQGDTVFECTLTVDSAPEETELTVISPAETEGVRAVFTADDLSLRYEGLQLSLGDAAAEYDSPLAAMPLLCRALREGHVVRAWTEKAEDAELSAAELYVDEGHALTVWFSGPELVPVHASLSADGREVIRCEIRDFAEQ